MLIEVSCYSRDAGTALWPGAVSNFVEGKCPRLITDAGEIRAELTLVLAGESYLSCLAKLHRSLLPVHSLIALTAPLTDAQWAAIGWRNRESVASCDFTVDYLNRTVDGRILFASRGAPYHFGSKISDDPDRHAETPQPQLGKQLWNGSPF